MRRMISLCSAGLIACTVLIMFTRAMVQAAAPSTPVGVVEGEVAAAAEQGRYSFIVFYRQQDPATDEMVDTIKRNVANRTSEAAVHYVPVTDPNHKAVIAKYGVSRAPMPVTVAVAPNGAITGVFPTKVSDQKLQNAFVSQAEANSLLALQQKKLVFITVSSSAAQPSIPAVASFTNDPHFKNRMTVVALDAADEAERAFLTDLQVNSENDPTALVVLAPPAVLVGRFPATATKSEIATAIGAANKCCEDPNCKHNAGK